MDPKLISDYKDLTIKKAADYSLYMEALNIVQNFIHTRDRILVGGQAIDAALRMKGEEGIYNSDQIPDYDIISTKYFEDAYDLGGILAKKGFKGISIINALHPTTMKVRLNFRELCDITYVPASIYNVIPTLKYKRFKIVHPHYQYIDQHRSFAYPYENAPRETILNRPVKDMERYDILYELYPLKKLNIASENIHLVKRIITCDLLKGQCIDGFIALNYWLTKAKQMGFKTDIDINIGFCKFESNQLVCLLPHEARTVIFSDDIEEYIGRLGSDVSPIYYNEILGKLPRKCIIDKFEIFDNNQKIMAFKIDDKNNIYIANLQCVMMYLLINYIIIMRVTRRQRYYSYYIGYLLARDLIKWAGEKYCEGEIDCKYKDAIYFLPNAAAYGARNITTSYMVSKSRFDIKNKDIEDIEATDIKNKFAQPRNVYDRDLIYGKVPKRYYEFDMSSSVLYDIDGDKTKK
jgi:hypothetical protein